MQRASVMVYALTALVSANGQRNGHAFIRASLPDRTIEAYILNKTPNLDPEPGVEYYWWKDQRFMTSTGGLSGALLDGPYSEYRVNGQLMVQGELRKGSRHGEWREWDEQGRLRTITRWRHGHLVTKRMAVGGHGITARKMRRAKIREDDDPPEEPREKASKKKKGREKGEEEQKKPRVPKKKRTEDPRT